MKTTNCPYEIQREVSRFEWAMQDAGICLKVVSFRLQANEDGVNGDIVAKCLKFFTEKNRAYSFVHCYLNATANKPNGVTIHFDSDENGKTKEYNSMREAMRPYGLKKGYNQFIN